MGTKTESLKKWQLTTAAGIILLMISLIIFNPSTATGQNDDNSSLYIGETENSALARVTFSNTATNQAGTMEYIGNPTGYGINKSNKMTQIASVGGRLIGLRIEKSPVQFYLYNINPITGSVHQLKPNGDPTSSCLGVDWLCTQGTGARQPWIEILNKKGELFAIHKNKDNSGGQKAFIINNITDTGYTINPQSVTANFTGDSCNPDNQRRATIKHAVYQRSSDQIIAVVQTTEEGENRDYLITINPNDWSCTDYLDNRAALDYPGGRTLPQPPQTLIPNTCLLYTSPSPRD